MEQNITRALGATPCARRAASASWPTWNAVHLRSAPLEGRIA